MLFVIVSCNDKPKPNENVSVTDVSLNKTSATLAAGTKETLTATVAPANASNKAVTWSSDKPEFASVGATTGEVTAVAAGSAKITVTTADGAKTATCTVTVTAAPTSAIVNTITLGLAGGAYFPTSSEKFQLGKDNTVKLIATTDPAGVAVTWSADNAKATVTDGVVTGVTDGDVNITATAGGKKAETKITIVAPGDYAPITTTNTGTFRYYLEYIKSEDATTNLDYKYTNPGTASTYEYSATALTVSKASNRTFKLKIKPGVSGSISSVFIDWNSDGYFYSNFYTNKTDPSDELESIFGTPQRENDNTEKEITVTIPTDARIGKTRMRFFSVWQGDSSGYNVYPTTTDAGVNTYRDISLIITE